MQNLISLFGRRYPLIAYLFFINDRSKFLPIAPRYMEKAFELLGIDFKLNKRCSWQNYSKYLSIISDVKEALQAELSTEVTLLDAHSFCWILSSQMEKENKI